MPFTIDDLAAAIQAIENELGLTPEGVYADVRTRLDILESRINNPFVPAPNVLNPFFIANTGVTIQAGIGDPNNLLAIPPTHIGSLFLREDGYTGVYSFRSDGYWHVVGGGGSGSTDASGVSYEPAVPSNWSPVPSVVSAALDQLINSGGSGASFIWEPTGSGTGPTNFADLHAVLAAITSLGGAAANLVIRIGGTGVFTLPVGTYAWPPNVTVTADQTHPGDETQINCPNGVVFTGFLPVSTLGVLFQQTGSDGVPLFTTSGSQIELGTIYIGGDDSGFIGNATNKSIRIASGYVLQVVVLGDSTIQVSNAFDVQAGGNLQISLFGNSALGVGNTNAGAFTIDLYDASSIPAGAVVGTLPAIIVHSTGTSIDPSYALVTTLSTSAFVEGYAPTTPGDWSPAPANVGIALDQLAGSAGGDSFIWQPGGTTSGNIFANFSDAVNAANKLNGAPTVIEIDTSITNPAVIPVGTYNLKGITFAGITPDTQVNIADGGVVFTNLPAGLNDIFLQNLSTSIVYTSPGGTGFLPSLRITGTECIIENTTTVPFARISTGDNLLVYADGIEVELTGTSSGAVFDMLSGTNLTVSLANASFLNVKAITNAGNVTVFITDDSTISSNAVTGAGTFSIQSQGPAASIDPSYLPNTIFLSKASEITYSPSESFNWSPVPGLVSTAFDELATELSPAFLTGGLLGTSNLPSAVSIADTSGAFVNIPSPGLSVTFTANSDTAVVLCSVGGTQASAGVIYLQAISSAGNISINHAGNQTYSGSPNRGVAVIATITGLTPGSSVTVTAQMRVDGGTFTIDPSVIGNSANLIIQDGGPSLLGHASVTTTQVVPNDLTFHDIGLSTSFRAISPSVVVLLSIGGTDPGVDNNWIKIVSDHGSVSINSQGALTEGSSFNRYTLATVTGLTIGDIVTIKGQLRADNATATIDPTTASGSGNLIVRDGQCILGSGNMTSPQTFLPGGGFVAVSGLSTTFTANSTTAIVSCAVSGDSPGTGPVYLHVVSAPSNDSGVSTFFDTQFNLPVGVVLTGLTIGSSVTVTAQLRNDTSGTITVDPTDGVHGGTIIVLDTNNKYRGLGETSVAPLSRAKWIDGNSSVDGAPNGSISNPYTTISSFLSAVPVPASSTDATLVWAGWLVPGQYTENLSIPQARSIELRAISGLNDAVIGDVTWDNRSISGSRPQPSAGAVLSLHNLFSTGNITVLNDGTLTSSLTVIISADEGAGVEIGNIDGSGATGLTGVLLQTASVVTGFINVPSASISAATVQGFGAINGPINALGGQFTGIGFGGNITFTGATTCPFRLCAFNSGIVLDNPGGVCIFDATSWLSFLASGSTRTSSTVVLVPGGYNSAPVEGANLTDADVTVSLSGSGATSGFGQGGNHYSLATSTLSTNRILTLGTGGANEGDFIRITRYDTTSNTYTIKDDTSATLLVMPAGQAASGLFQFKSGHFVLVDPQASVGSSGITVQNNGTTVGSGFTTLNLFGLTAVASGSTADVTASGGVGSFVNVTNGSPATLTNLVYIAIVDSTTGTTSVTMDASPFITQTALVIDDTNNASVNNITVSGNGNNVEDPAAPGTFSASVTLSSNSGTVEWIFTGNHWKVR